MKGDVQRGVKFYSTKKYEQALNEFMDSGIEPADDEDLAYYLGLTLTQVGRFDDALVYLEMVINEHDSFLHIFQSRMILGYIYSVTGRFKLAEFEFTKLLEYGLESVQIYASLGYISYCQKKVDESVEYLKKSISLDPTYPNALNTLGFIYAAEGIDVSAGLEYCKRAVKLRPENAAYQDSLGWAYFKNGEYDEARTCLRKALDSSPGNRQIAGHLKAVLAAKNSD